MKKDELLDEDVRANATRAFDGKAITRINDAKIEANDFLKKMKLGRWVLFLLAGLNVFALFLAFSQIQESVIQPTVTPGSVSGIVKYLLLSGLFTVLPYLLLGIFFPRAPRLCLGLGLGLYLAGFILQYVFSGFGISLLQGIIWRAALITALVFPLYCGFRFYGYLEKLKQLGIAPAEIQALEKLQPVRKTKRAKA